MRSLLPQQIDRSLLCLAVDAHVGDRIEPDLCGGVDGGEFGELEAVEEILFDVAHARLDASFFVRPCNIAGCDGEAVVACKVQITRIEHRATPTRRRNTADLRS